MTQGFLDCVKFLDANQDSLTKERSALRQDIIDILESRSNLYEKVDTRFSRISSRLVKLCNAPFKTLSTTKYAKTTVVYRQNPSHFSSRHGRPGKDIEDYDISSNGSPRERETPDRSFSPTSGSGSEIYKCEDRRESVPQAPDGRRHCGLRLPSLKAMRPNNPVYEKVTSYRT